MKVSEPLIPVYFPSNDSDKIILLSLFNERNIEYSVENQNNQDLFGVDRFGGYNYITGPERILVSEFRVSDAKSIIDLFKQNQTLEDIS